MTKKSLHWTEEKEQARGNKGLRLAAWLVKTFPLWAVYLCALPVAFFYMVFSDRARREVFRFQTQLNEVVGQKKRVRYYAPIFSFALALLEKFAGWLGKIPATSVVYGNDDIDDLAENLAHGTGAVFVCSHLGNIEVMRSLASRSRTYVQAKIPTTVIMDLGTTVNFNETLKLLSGDSELDVIDPKNIGIDTMARLSDRVANGGIVVIAGDRTSKSTIGRSLKKEFLGREALFPYGSFLLVALLKVPVYFVFGIRTKIFTLAPKNKMRVHKALTSLECGRKEREACIENLCGEFVCLLEKYARENPYQWYNFYDFWSMPGQ